MGANPVAALPLIQTAHHAGVAFPDFCKEGDAWGGNRFRDAGMPLHGANGRAIRVKGREATFSIEGYLPPFHWSGRVARRPSMRGTL